MAPIALYPDPLLGQALAASTYPLELVEAEQWLEQHRDLRGSQMIGAARQMNWDASVQAMVSFSDVLRTLTRNISWTTDLGNAFLSQQADVMDAIQRLRGRAWQNGRLASTPEQVVAEQNGSGRNAVVIQPADPQVLYVPVYNPYAVWGAPAVGTYPSLGYAPDGSGSGFGAANVIGSLFSGLASWSAWGWGLNWLTHDLFLNGLFFNQFGSAGFGGGGYGGGYGSATAWAHNPVHRLGVPYASTALASRFAGAASRGGWQTFGRSSAASVSSGGWRSFGTHGAPAYSGYSGYNSGNSHAFSGAAPGYRGGYASSGYSGRTPQSYASMAPQKNYSAKSYREPRGSWGGHFSAPKSHGFKAPKNSAPKFSSHGSRGHSGGHSKGGHHH